ncbi:MAG: hypothetical protein IPK18_00800 [Sphingobacteriales bacterium]|nr:MAG: hypothetical protein IPK18_00800 [Sphingobacteriales bacterium]
MEIRSSLKKIDSYIKIVSDLNSTILEEGTMAPEELQIMKKYLLNCVDRISDIQTNLGISVADNNFVSENNDAEIQAILQEEQQNNVEEIIENNSIANNVENNKIVSNHQLQADLPSIQFENELNFEKYTKEIPALVEETVINQNSNSIVDNSFTKNNFLVADEVEKVEDKIEFKTETIIQEAESKINLVADEIEKVEDKIEFKSETIIQEAESKVNLVADEVEKVEDKIEFKTETIIPEIESKVNLVADEIEKVEDKIEFKSETIIQEAESKVNLVADEVEKVEDKIEFKTETIIQEAESKIDLVADDIEEVEEKIEFNKQNLINEYESIINRRSLSDAIALNDKFIFVRELFGSQFTEYENNIKKIDEFSSHQEAIDYCKNILSPKYNWENKQSIAGRFFELLSKNFKQ